MAFSFHFLPIVTKELEKQVPALRGIKGLDGFTLSLQVFGEIVVSPRSGEDGPRRSHGPVPLEDLVMFLLVS